MTPAARLIALYTAQYLLEALPEVARLARLRAGLPPEGRRKLAVHTGTLAAHVLVRHGITGSSQDLLGLACLVPGARRNAAQALEYLNPERGGFSEVKLDQARGWLQNALLTLQLYETLPEDLRQGVLELGSALGVAFPKGEPDSLEVLQALERFRAAVSPSYRAELLPLCRSLSPAEGREVARFALRLVDLQGETEKPSAPLELLHRLACQVPGALDGLHAEIARRGILYPPDLFRGADAATCVYLASLLELREQPPNLILPALAWVADDAVEACFRAWQVSPPAWAASLPTAIPDYTREAGWELAGDQGRRPLYPTTCLTLVPRANGEDRPITMTTLDEACGWCGRPLAALLDLPLADPRVHFLGLEGERLRIATCENCTGYGTTYTHADGQGNVRWHPSNEKPEYLPEPEEFAPPSGLLVLGPPRRTPYEAHFRLEEDGASQVGGFPSWIDDALYPPCPECGAAMPFLGQVQMSDLGEPAEGITYAFYCRACRIAATTYQQT